MQLVSRGTVQSHLDTLEFVAFCEMFHVEQSFGRSPRWECFTWNTPYDELLSPALTRKSVGALRGSASELQTDLVFGLTQLMRSWESGNPRAGAECFTWNYTLEEAVQPQWRW
jgi:hypothetical protein